MTIRPDALILVRMEIKGSEVILTVDEQVATGLPSPVPVEQVNTVELLDQLYARENGLLAMRGADDDELTHAERASIPEKFEQLEKDRVLIVGLVSQMTVHGVERALRNR